MANTFSSATLGLGVDTKGFVSDIDTAGRKVESALESMKLSADAFEKKWGSLTSGIKDTKRIVSGILVSQGFYALSNALIDAGSAAFSFSKNMETAQISMEYFVTGADKAAKAAAYLRTMNTFAAKTPFSTEEAISLSKYMQAVGVSMGVTKSFLSVITDTAAATGATEENLQRIVFGLGQMMTKGRLANEEIRQLANANIPIYEILQEQLGLTGEQISNIGTQWVSADKAVTAILTGLDKRYAGAADKVANTITGMTDTILDDAKIIANIAGQGAYDALAQQMTNVRDALDRYREIATEQGTGGLLTQVLIDLDASGQVGTEILSLIGNTYQLGKALRDLYIAAQPVIHVFGRSIQVSFTVAEMSLTALTKTVTEALRIFEYFGITSGQVGTALASLFIAYKAAKWIALVGEGAAAAAYSTFEATQALAAFLPASLNASFGAKMLAASLASIVTYGIAAAGIFAMINNAMSGLNTEKTNDNVLPDEYTEKYTAYTAAMVKYNAAIDKYNSSFEQPYKAIDDGTDQAISNLEDVADASSSAASSVKNDWLAAFDEVYAPPDNSGTGGGGGGLLSDLADLGALLNGPAFSFPAIGELGMPEMPTFDIGDMFKDSVWNTDNVDALSGDWWKYFLPVALSIFASKFGSVITKKLQEAADKKNGGSGFGGSLGSGNSSAFQDEAAASKVLKGLGDRFVKEEAIIDELLKKIKALPADDPALEALYKKLALQTDEATKLQERINTQAIIAGKSATLSSSILGRAQEVVDFQAIKKNIELLNDKLNYALDQGTLGTSARKDIAGLKAGIEKQYNAYILKNGPSAALDELVKGSIDTGTLFQKADVLVEDIDKLRKTIIDAGYSTADMSARIASLSQQSKEIVTELEKLGINNGVLTDAAVSLKEIRKLQTLQNKLLENTLEYQKLQEVQSTLGVRKTAGQNIDGSVLRAQMESLDTNIRATKDAIAAQSNLISAGNSLEVARYRAQQQEIDIGNKVRGLLDNTISTRLAEIIQPLKAFEVYPAKMLLTEKESLQFLNKGVDAIDDVVVKLDKLGAQDISALFTSLKESIKDAELVGSNPGPEDFKAPSITADAFAESLAREVQKTITGYGATSEIVGPALERIYKKVDKISGHTVVLDTISERVKEAAKAAEEANAQAKVRATKVSILDILDNNIARSIELAKSLEDFTSKMPLLKAELEKRYPAQTGTEYAQELINAALREGEMRAAQHFSWQDALAEFSNDADKTQKILTDSQKKLELMGKELSKLREETVGKGIRRGYADAASYAPDIVKQSGIFDNARIALSGGDAAGMYGKSGYGVTPPTALIGNLSKAAKEIYNLPDEMFSMLTLAEMSYGQALEPVILSTANKMLKELRPGTSLGHGDVFFNSDRTMQAQLDALVNRRGKFIAPMDAKAISDIDKKFLPFLKETATYTNGIYTVQSKYFEKFVGISDDIGYQMAHIAAVMDTDSAYLAILDRAGLGIGKPDVSEVARYNVVANKKYLQDYFKAQAAERVMPLLEDMNKNIYLVRLNIPKEAKEAAKLKAQIFRKYTELVAEASIKGADLKEILALLDTLGNKLGEITYKRYTSGAYKLPSVGNPYLQSILRDIEVQLKNTYSSVQQIGSSRLDSLIESVQELATSGVSPSTNLELDLGPTMMGTSGKLVANTDQLLALLPTLREFKDAYTGYAAAQASQLDGLITKMNEAASKNLGLDDVAYYTAKGEAQTVKDLAFAIQRTNAKIPGDTSVINGQVGSILSGGAAMPMTNPHAYGDLGVYVAQLTNLVDNVAKNGDEGTNGVARLGGSIQWQYTYAQAMTDAFEKAATGRMSAVANDAGIVFGERAGSKFAEFIKSKTGVTYGKYSAFDTGAAGAESAETWTAAEQGLWAQGKSGKTLRVSSDTLSNVVNGIGLVAQVASIIAGTASTRSTFNKTVLPTLDPAEQEAAKARANDMGAFGLSGWDSGIGAGSTATAFLDKYSEMTDQERIFWGSMLSNRSKSFNMLGLGSDADVLQNALSDVNNPFGLVFSSDTSGPAPWTPNSGKSGSSEKTDKQILQDAMEAGIDESNLAKVVDYLVKSGDTDSTVAKSFYKRYGAYMNEIVMPKYGVDEDFNRIMNSMLTSTDEGVKEFIKQLGLSAETSADSLDTQSKILISGAITELQDKTEAYLLPAIQAQSAGIKANSESPLSGDYSRALLGVDTSTLGADIREELKNTLGISFKQLEGDSGSVVNFDSSELMDNISGWVTKLPDTISLDGATISTQDAEILAQAGIQVNGDGTVTFMKAMNENTTGTERNIELTIADVSKDVTDKLKESGLSFDFSSGEASLDLSLQSVSEKMQTAMFKLNKDFSGQVSSDMADALSGLGTVLDSGYFEITNDAVLNGEMTIQQYMDSMGIAVDKLSPELQSSLAAIDGVIAQGGEATRQTVAEFADGISMPSPIDASALTDEMREAFSAVGISFEEQAGQFMMVVNRVGDQLADGVTIIPEETWSKLDSGVIEALQALGVTMTTQAGQVMVDVSGTMDSGIGSIIELFANRPDLWDQIPTALVDSLAAAGFAVENGMLSINTAMLNGLVQLDTQWYGSWSSLSPDIIAAMGAANLATSNGLITLEKMTADTVLPANINDYVVKPFDELPAEIQDSLTGGDSSVAAALAGSEIVITNSTEYAFAGAIQTVRSSFGTMATDAASGAASIAQAVADALAQVNAMNNITVKKDHNIFDDNNKVEVWGSSRNYTVKYGGNQYTDIDAPTAAAAIKLVNQRFPDLNIPEMTNKTKTGSQYASGGIIDTDGLYRAGEFGKKEGIIPLENRNSLSMIGHAIGKTMYGISSPIQRSQLMAARSLTNGGVVLPTNNSAQQANTQALQTGSMPGAVQTTDVRPIVYVQTMIADKQGLRELEDRLQIIRLGK